MVVGAMVIVAMVSRAKGCFQETTPEESVAMANDVMMSGCYGEWVE